MAKRKLSYSAMETYKQCPYKYFKKHIKFEKPKVPVRYPLVVGVAFHQLMEHMYQGGDYSKEYMMRHWKHTFEECLQKEGSAWADTSESKEHESTGYMLINCFYKFAKNNGYLIKPLSAEWHFDIQIDDMFVTGKTDLIIQRDPSQPIEIIDFKTGFAVSTQEQADKNEQLTMYDWAAKTLLGYSNTVVGLLYPRKGKLVLSKRDTSHHEALKAKLWDLHNKIKAEAFDPNFKHCESCEFARTCDQIKFKGGK